MQARHTNKVRNHSASFGAILAKDVSICFLCCYGPRYFLDLPIPLSQSVLDDEAGLKR